MKTARRFITIAALFVAPLTTSLSPALAAPHHRTAYPYGHAPTRITVYPAYPSRIDFDRYIDPISGMYCRNTGWAAVCVLPQRYWQSVDCVAGWPFPVCGRF